MNFSSLTSQTADQALEKLDSAISGLSETEAARRLIRCGRNELAGREMAWHKILLRQFRSPFLYLLLPAALIAFLLSEFVDAAMIAAFVLINAGLGFVQEFHSERSVALLRQLVKARCRVRRDRQEKIIDCRELVPGDVITIETGDMLHADVRFVETDGLLIDESVLTGESVQIAKSAAAMSHEAQEPYQAANIGFSGTTVASGRAVAVVIATGGGTQMGEIAAMTGQAETEGAFAKGLRRFSSFILRTIFITLAVVFAANILVKGAGVDIPELLIFSIALAVSVIPEALPLVTTTTLSRGALRLAHKKVVVKRLSAIEDLGSIEVLCTDKTGTLTENELAVAEVFGDRDQVLYLAAAGASFLGEKKPQPNNAFDIALWESLPKKDQARALAAKRSDEVPFDPRQRFNSVVVDEMVVVRGALEEVMGMCEGKEVKEGKEIKEWAREQGKKGRRVLAVAVDRKFTGAIAFEDPVRKSAKQAIVHARSLGVSVKILTGDAPEVAASVAMEVGLIDSPEQVMTGEAWMVLSDEERLDSAQNTAVFARVSPQEKFAIIETLKRDQEVGFLGEGINDAPALKIASVGIVVDSASDIAREAADIVLLKHSLEVVVTGIREGREVFANTVKYIKATLASNFGNFLAVASATLFIDFLPMLPLQILLLNLLSDFPMIAIAADTVDPDELKRPRSYDIRDIVYAATVIGVVSTVFDFIFFALFVGGGASTLQTNWFIGSILTELVLIFSIRTHRPFWKAKAISPVLAGLSAVAFGLTLILPFTSLGQNLFRFIQPSPGAIIVILVVVGVYFAVTELVKLSYYRSANGAKYNY
jgi:Mg2+-importing ATPase